MVQQNATKCNKMGTQNGDAKWRDSAKNELIKSVRMVRQGIRRKDRQNQVLFRQMQEDRLQA